MSSISVGLAIYELLVGSDELKSVATKIFPVITDAATLPYVYYRVTGMEQTPAKDNGGADTVHVETNCLAPTYGEAVELAEKVRKVLDYVRVRTDGGLYIRSCTMTGMEHYFEDDAFVVSLNFTVRVNQE